jgi:hypothetical protein
MNIIFSLIQLDKISILHDSESGQANENRRHYSQQKYCSNCGLTEVQSVLQSQTSVRAGRAILVIKS